jgi:hypothetical protein
LGESITLYAFLSSIIPIDLQITVAREIPAYAGFYAGFEYTKRRFQSVYGEDIPIWSLIASGSCGGIAYWLCCYPLGTLGRFVSHHNLLKCHRRH